MNTNLGIKSFTEMNEGGGIDRVLYGPSTQYVCADGTYKTFPTTMTPTGHYHNAGDITTGQLDLARLPSIDPLIGTFTSLRGTNLISNGYGELGNNYNWPGATFIPTDARGNAHGSFMKHSSCYASEKIKVDLTKEYEYSCWIKAVPDAGQSINTTCYIGLDCFDIDGNSIRFPNYAIVANTTTTLAQDLKNGDTKVYLTNGSAWSNSTSYSNRIIFWNYIDSTGYEWPIETYSRNQFGPLWDLNTAAIDPVAGTVTLKSAWAYPNPNRPDGVWPAGTPLSQGLAGNTFIYPLLSYNPPAIWTKKSAIIKGVQYGGSGNIYTQFRPGTVSVVPFVYFTANPTYTMYWCAMDFRETTASASHTHSYLPLAGGSLTGSLSISASSDLTLAKHAGLNRLAYFDATGKIQSDASITTASFSKTDHTHPAVVSVLQAERLTTGRLIGIGGAITVPAECFNGENNLILNATHVNADYLEGMVPFETLPIGTGSNEIPSYNHLNDYLPLSGGEIKGNITLNNDNAYNMGTTHKRWGIVYANIFSGSLNGTATFADDLSDGSILSVTKGGTGMGTYAPGELIYAIDSTNLGRLTMGHDKTILTSSGSALSWLNLDQLGIATANHTHEYLPLRGGTLTGIVTTTSEILFNAGNTNKYITYTSGITHNWRIGYEGVGSGNENYLVFESTKTTTDTWSKALYFGCETHNAHFSSNILPTVNNSKDIGSTSLKWANIYATTFTGNLSGTALYANDLSNSSILSASKGGTGISTYSIGNLLYANSSTSLSKLSISSDGSLLMSSGSIPMWLSRGTDNQVLGIVSGMPKWISAPSSGPSAGNPSKSIGLTTNNGVATTFMRSDAAPALNQSISPTWTGNHIFNNATRIGSSDAGDSFYSLLVTGDVTVESGNHSGLYIVSTVTKTGGVATTQAFGILGQVHAKGSIIDNARALDFKVYVPSSGKVATATGLNVGCQVTAGGEVTGDAIAIHGYIQRSTNGIFNNVYGLKLTRSGAVLPTGNIYGVYQEDSEATNVFKGFCQFDGGTNLVTSGRVRNFRTMSASGTINHVSGTDTLIIASNTTSSAAMQLPTTATAGDRIELYSTNTKGATNSFAYFTCSSSLIWPVAFVDPDDPVRVSSWGSGVAPPGYLFAIWDGTYWRVGYLNIQY